MRQPSKLVILVVAMSAMTVLLPGMAQAGADPSAFAPEQLVKCDLDGPYPPGENCGLIRVRCEGFNPCEHVKPTVLVGCKPSDPFYVYTEDLRIASIDIDVVKPSGEKIEKTSKDPRSRYNFLNIYRSTEKKELKIGQGAPFGDGAYWLDLIQRCASNPIRNCGKDELKLKDIASAQQTIKQGYSGKLPDKYTFALQGFTAHAGDLAIRMQSEGCHACEESAQPATKLKTVSDPRFKDRVFCVYNNLKCKPSLIAGPNGWAHVATSGPGAYYRIGCAVFGEKNLKPEEICPSPTVCANDPHVSIKIGEIQYKPDGDPSSAKNPKTSININ